VSTIDPVSTCAAELGPGRADSAAIAEAVRLLTAAENPVVLLGLLASKPANAEAVRAFLDHNKLAVVGTFQSAGAVGEHLLESERSAWTWAWAPSTCGLRATSTASARARC
jgi:thiamine pyrophosphate-dependent acetolactate synthase large subunit-like protein